MENLQGQEKTAVDFMSIVNTLPLVVWTAAPDGGLTYISRQWEDIYDNPVSESLGNGWATFVHPDDVEKAGAEWVHSLQTGENYEAEFRVRYKKTDYQWILVRAIPNYNASGEIISWNGSNTNINDKKHSEAAARESERNLRNVILQAPVAMAILKGKDHVVELANEFMFELLGKGSSDLMGKPIFTGLPEARGQGFEALLDGVYKTGETFSAQGVAVSLTRNGEKQNIFTNSVYQAYRQPDGSISGIIAVATDVTKQVTSGKKIQEAEEFLRGAVELANLGTWTLDLKTRTLEYDGRIRNWFGFSSDEIIDVDRAYSPILEEDRHLVKASMTHALTPGTNGIYDVEYRIKNLKDASTKIIHAQGRAIFNEENEVYKITGTAQDVTIERNIESELTRQVQQRTEELAASNEELQATNEEIAATNEELEESNLKLMGSNAELEQFAYIASHDLQEPVRKISTFMQMLEKSLGNISEKSKNYLDKINVSADRMSILIRDVLAYSHLSSVNDNYEDVDLNQVLHDAVSDFELSVEHKKAVIAYSGLPTIEAIPLQMSQLFSNLLSNALKYSKDDVSPEIKITAGLLTRQEAAEYPILAGKKAYYKIQFSDNGIGIQEDQIERIFNIFQRLHARNEYAGTGIGLSICKKIVSNHHGHITAVSSPGGTTFDIILPQDFRKNLK